MKRERYKKAQVPAICIKCGESFLAHDQETMYCEKCRKRKDIHLRKKIDAVG